MKKALFAVALVALVSLLGCQKQKTTTIKTPDGKTITATTSSSGKVLSVTTK